MVCKVCGRTVMNESANFCENCGTRLSDMDNSFSQYQYADNRNTLKDTGSDRNDEDITTGGWMKIMLLRYIPVIGWFIYLIMLFVWSFSSDTPITKKGWARATLICGIISLILIIIYFSAVMANFINSGMDIESYINSQYY